MRPIYFLTLRKALLMITLTVKLEARTKIETKKIRTYLNNVESVNFAEYW